MIDMLILDTIIVTVNKKREVFEDYGLAINNNLIIDVGPSSIIRNKFSAKKTIDGRGKVVFPGFVNTHNHSYQSLLKGLGADMTLSDWLMKMALPSLALLNKENAYYGSLLCYAEGIRSGTTTMVDMFPHSDYDICEGVINAIGHSGIRGVFARSYIDDGIDFGILPKGNNYLDRIASDLRSLIEKYHDAFDGKLQFRLAPSQLWCNSSESLKMTKRLADEYGLGVTIHISETQFDRDSCTAYHGLSEMKVLEKYGLINPKLLMVHCVLLNSQEVLLTKKYDAKVAYSPVCNMYLSSGVAPIPHYLDNNITVGLATEGASCNNSNDMIETLKFAVLLQKVNSIDPTVLTAEKILDMATIDGAKSLGLENEIGSIEIGKKADLFIFNPMLDIKAVPMHNPINTLVYSSSAANVETVIIDGNIVLEKGFLKNIDEKKVIKKVQGLADELAADVSMRSFNGKIKTDWEQKH